MKKEILHSALYNLLAITIGFLIVRITLDYLGEELYGKWGVALSLIYFLNLFEFGLGNSIRNHVTELLVNKKVKIELKEKILSIWSFQIILIYALSITALAVSIIFSTDNFNFFNILCVILFPLLVCSNLVRSLYHGIKRSRKVYRIKTLSTLAALGSLLFFTKFIELRLFALEIVLIINILPQILIKVYYLGRFFIEELDVKMNFYLLIPKGKSIKYLINSSIFNDGISYFLINIGNLFLINSIPILLSYFIADREVTVFTINQKLYGVYLQFFYVILTPFWSQLNLVIRKESIKEFDNIIRKLSILCLLLILGIVVIKFIEFPFHKIWLGKTDILDKKYTVLIALYTIVMGINAILGHFLNSINELKIQRTLTLFNTILIVPIGITVFHYSDLRGYSFLISINIFISIQMFILLFKSIKLYKNVRNSWIY